MSVFMLWIIRRAGRSDVRGLGGGWRPGVADGGGRRFSGMAGWSVGEFLEYLDRVHERTRRVVVLIPRGDIEWSPKAGWFTIGGLVRHLAGIERWMYAETVHGRPPRY